MNLFNSKDFSLLKELNLREAKIISYLKINFSTSKPKIKINYKD